ncbi:hypothetical protein [Streptomyces djakartensis]|uniref:Peptidase n=1 Tax=Streptomyces djakartensis TaxID=68193 RepID=A0ABQ3A0W6_9ACTN|nr:hypothetical protein [Streptomyces djakartensis]GGY29104.1 hypothetical protein GCM10010384_40130 [Streptomyces djakartensis]
MAVRLGVVAVVLGATAIVGPGQAALAAAAVSGTGASPGPYAFAEGARSIEGARSTADADPLEPGTTYKSSLPSSGKISYRLTLDASSNAYVSVTAVPSPGSTVSAIDGVKVYLEDDNGASCSVDTTNFGAARSPHPIAAWGRREISPGRSLCREAGTYYVFVERVDPDGEGSSPDAWDLELVAMTEPPAVKAGATSAPEVWDSASPQPLQGEAEERRGGGGFAGATPLDRGVWRDDIRPGRTLFYAVPVDWGQQLHVTAELASSDSGGTGYLPGALNLALYNPARGQVADVGVGYDGGQKSGSLPVLPPVDHANRHAAVEQTGAMRFAGSYYLVAHLAQDVADSFGDGPFVMTLRVRVSGAAQDGPGYAGESEPKGVFDVSDQDREAAAEGVAAGDEAALRAVAVGGIGTGSALLVGLGVWTVLTRRRNAV